MRTTQITQEHGVYRISLAWSNCYVLQNDTRSDVWLIDTGLYSDRSDLLKALVDLGIEPRQVGAVLLSHGHCDHAGSAAYFNTEFGAKIYAHIDEIVYLNDSRTPYGNSILNSPFSLFQSLVFRIGERRYPVERCRQLNTLDDGDELAAPGGVLRAVHSPGHTPGHTAYYRESDGLLFSGDAVLNIVPHIVPSRRRVGLCIPPKLFCSNWKDVHTSALKLAQLRPSVLASGHGPPLAEETAERMAEWALSGLSINTS
jgi:glyoxylase-like metal-dependent hydrolase (beta-lactamase superfamily II)